MSLTRSNADGDIGFLKARERLVVLMSRARKGMVLFGNMLTFMKNKKGGDMWKEYFDLLKKHNCLFEGIPVRCERHPDNTSQLLKSPEDFDKYCPDGGCAEPCMAILSCGKHKCERFCHRVVDHSKVQCQKRLDVQCTRGHKRKIPCGTTGSTCSTCEREDKEAARRIKRDLNMERIRLEKQEQYRRELEAVEDDLDQVQRAAKYELEERKQAESLQRKKEELKSLRDAAEARVKAKKKRGSNQLAGAPQSRMRSRMMPARPGPTGRPRRRWKILATTPWILS